MKVYCLLILLVSSFLIADEPTFTVDAKVLDFDGDRQVLKAEDVVIAFKNGAKLMSRHAEMDFDSIHGVVSSGKGDEKVIFTGFVTDENQEPRPIIVKATLKGDAMAMRIFGDYWRTGYGCKKNHLMAKMCYEDSVNHGNEKARKRLKKYYSKGE